MKKLGLYIHIPFCKQKCNYCDFYSKACTQKISQYISAISRQIENDASLYRDCEFDTIFIGGGTPSLIEPCDFEKLSSTIKSSLKLTQGLEFSIEANPGTLTKEKLIAYKNAGVNRLSIGLQSTDNTTLKALGRIHTLEDFENSYYLARECGFENISLDLMYSLPNQRTIDFEKALKKAISYAPEHISAYSLKIEENTPFGRIKDKLTLPSEDEEYDMYMLLCSTLEKNGYKQYEISNFSKEGYSSRHNLKYWLSEEYIGIGPSAHSFFNGQRYFYDSTLDEYIEAIECGSYPTKILEETEEIRHSQPKISKKDEYIMLKLRLSSGVDEKEYSTRFEGNLTEDYPQIKKYLDLGYMKKQGNSYSLTPKGFFISNYILTDILSFGI